MKRMIQGCGLALAVALTLSAALGVSAGDKAKLTSSGNTTALVTDFSQEGIELSLNGKTKPEGVLAFEMTDDGVKLTADASFTATYESVVRIKYGDVNPESDKNLEGIQYDWTDSIALDVAVDASATTKATAWVIGIMPTTAGTTNGVWMETAAGSKAYIQADGASDWTEVTVSDKRSIELPAGFKGTVRVSLDGNDMGGGPWNTDNTKTQGDISANLAHVSTMYLSVSGDTQPVYVQKVSTVKYGEASGGQDNTTADKNSSTTKAPGAQTGEPFPALALALIPAAGVVLACTRKKH